MDNINPSINIGPLSISYSDVSSVFKVIAESFRSGKDPDKGLVQINVLLENEITTENIWTSKSTIDLMHNIWGGLKVLYHYNSEALGAKQIFEDYTQNVRFSELPKDIDTTLFLLARSAISNKCDQSINNKNAFGFIALFTPPISQHSTFRYEYFQTYKSFRPLWGDISIEINKDYRFLRHTEKFTRTIKFPINYYRNIQPDCFLLNKDKSNKLDKSNTIFFENISDEKNSIWKISVENPPKGSVLRVRWERPKVTID